MKERGLYLWIAFVLALAVQTKAQDFVDLDWSNWAGDTLLPCYTETRALSDEEAKMQYRAVVEYPEFEEMSPAYVSRLGLDKEGVEPLPDYPVAETHVGVSAKKPQLDICFIPVVFRDGRYYRVTSFKLRVEASLPPLKARSRVAANEPAARYAEHSVLSSGRWVKVRVTDTGIYKITAAELSSMGFSDMSKVRLYGYGGNILPESGIENLPDDLQEVPLWREPGYVLFYGKGTVKWNNAGGGAYTHTQNHYATYGCYFITADDSIAPMEFPVEAALEESGGTVTVESYPDYVLYEVEQQSWASYGRKLFDSYDFLNGRSRSYSFDLEGVTDDAASLTVAFATNSTVTSTLKVTANGTDLGTMSFSAMGSYASAVSLTQKYSLASPAESLSVTLFQTTYSASASGRLDFLRLNFTRSLTLRGSYTAFRKADATASVKFRLQNATQKTKVWRIASDGSVAQLSGTFQNSGVYEMVTSNEADDEFVALNTGGTFKSVEVAGTVTPQDLHALAATDFVIIVPASGNYMAQARQLAQAHIDRDSMTVAVLRADQVYNEFSSGTPDATAYRRLLKMLYDRAATADEAPKYLLLYGAGIWDNRMLTPAWSGTNPDDYLLCFESENSISEVRSYVMEDYFGLLDDGEGASLLLDKVDVGVGRFPVQTSGQADDVLNKTLRYMNNGEVGAWKNTVCILGDDGDNNQHMSDAETVASLVEGSYPSYLVKRVYWDNFEMEVTATGNRYPAVQKRIGELIEEGTLMMNYTGHGSPDVLSHELVVSTADMENYASARLPLWVTASCTVGPFDNGDASLGVAGMLNPRGGGIAMFTTARTVYSAQNRRINQLFTKYVLGRDVNGRRNRLGDAVRLAKCGLITSTSANLRDWSENKLQFALLGDPALKLAAPEYEIVVDSFNGGDITAETTLSAGSKAMVSGHVIDGDGNVATGYNGLVYPVVMDNKETVTTRNNEDAATDPFVFTERSKMLYSGSDSVRGGYFNFVFPVPLDINYSYKSGLLNLYTVNNEKDMEAQGSYSGFLIGGTDANLSTDSVGPALSLYLNTADFVDGDEVNTTPLLIATLQDDDGINTVGNGIGHDIVAIIDNKAAYTFTLNNYFTAEPGDYTKGTVIYSLPELEEGEHSLLFRSWDILNNSSTATINFTVVKGLSPQVVQAAVSPNPARESATFTVSHNRPQSEVTVKLEVYNFMGQMLWSNSENTTTSGTDYSCTWNLCASGGQPLLPGVYLYRASVSCDGSSWTSKTRKLIILRNK